MFIYKDLSGHFSSIVHQEVFPVEKLLFFTKLQVCLESPNITFTSLCQEVPYMNDFSFETGWGEVHL